MRILGIFAVAVSAAAQQAPLALDQVLSASFPSELIAAPSGGKVAWVSDVKGVRNIMVAEGPQYPGRARSRHTPKTTARNCWTCAGPLPPRRSFTCVAATPTGAVKFPTRRSIPPEPAKISGSRTSMARRPANSPKAIRPPSRRAEIAWPSYAAARVWLCTARRQVHPHRSCSKRAEIAAARCGRLTGSRLAFTSERVDHTFTGVFDTTANSLRYLDPGTGPRPRARMVARTVPHIAFLRVPSSGG